VYHSGAFSEILGEEKEIGKIDDAIAVEVSVGEDSIRIFAEVLGENQSCGDWRRPD